MHTVDSKNQIFRDRGRPHTPSCKDSAQMHLPIDMIDPVATTYQDVKKGQRQNCDGYYNTRGPYGWLLVGNNRGDQEQPGGC